MFKDGFKKGFGFFFGLLTAAGVITGIDKATEYFKHNYRVNILKREDAE